MAKKEEQLEKLTEIFDNIRPEYVQAAQNPPKVPVPAAAGRGKAALRWVLIAAAAVTLVGVLFAGFIFNGYLKEKYGRPASSGVIEKTESAPITETPPVTEGPEGTEALPEGTTGDANVSTSSPETTVTPQSIDTPDATSAPETTDIPAATGTSTGTETGVPAGPGLPPPPESPIPGRECVWMLEYPDRLRYDNQCGKPCAARYKCNFGSVVYHSDVFHVEAADHIYENGRCQYCTCLDEEYLAAEGLTYALNADGTYSVTGMSADCPYTFINIPAEHNGKRVTDIADSAFAGNTKITAVRFEGITSEDSHWGAYRKNITPKQGVIRIGAHAFDGCTALTLVFFPETLEGIGDYAFRFVPLEQFYFEGCLKTLGSYAFFGARLGRMMLEKSVLESIAPYAFAESGLTDLVAPGTVKSIGAHAFENCKSLKSISMLPTQQSFGAYAFAGCSSLEVVQGVDVTAVEVGENAFLNCTAFLVSSTDPETGLAYRLAEENVPGRTEALRTVAHLMGRGKWEGTDLIIPQTIAGYPVTEITDGFSGDTKLESVSVSGPNLIRIYNSFRYCTNLQSVRLPDSLEGIYSGSFAGCTSLRTVILENISAEVSGDSFLNCPESPIQPDANGLVFRKHADGSSYAVYQYVNFAAGTDSVKVPATRNGLPVTEICASAFRDARDLRNVILPDSVTAIGEKAFYGAGISSIVLPAGLKVIPKECFNGNAMLHSIVLPQGLERIEAGAFSYSGISEIRIPDSVTFVGDSVFMNCTSLTELPVGRGMRTIPKAYVFRTGVLRVTIPEYITTVDRNALPDGVREVIYLNPNTQFTGTWEENCCWQTWVPGETCVNDEESGVRLALRNGTYWIMGPTPTAETVRYLPSEYQGIPVTGIADHAFNTLKIFDSDTVYSFPASMTYLGVDAFRNVQVNGVSVVKDEASGVRLELDGNTYSIAGQAFSGKTVNHLPASYNGIPVTSVKEKAFYKKIVFNSGTVYEIPASVTRIGAFAFLESNIRLKEIPATVTEIGNSAYNRYNLVQ